MLSDSELSPDQNYGTIIKTDGVRDSINPNKFGSIISDFEDSEGMTPNIYKNKR